MMTTYEVWHGQRFNNLMTENAYMTDDAWLEASNAIVKGYRQLPFMKENKDWYIIELLDGCKSHKNVLKAHKICADQLIVSLKEESNSSHVNQGYDQLTAKNDKKNAAESLYEQRRAKKWQTGKSHIDQYDLVLTAMRIVRATMQSTWVSSFQRVNLHPGTRVSFPKFCKKMAGFLWVSKSFKDESVAPTPKVKFALLPLFWHAMQPSDRKVMMTIVGSHGFHYSAACLQMLRLECRLAYVNPRMRTTSLCGMCLPICEFFCLTPRTHRGTPRMRTGISL